MLSKSAFLILIAVLHHICTYAVTEYVLVDNVRHQLDIQHQSSLFKTTSNFCNETSLSFKDCQVLTNRFISRFAQDIQLDFLEPPKHLSILLINADVHAIRISTLIKNSNLSINGHHVVRVKINNNRWITALPDQNKITAFDVQTRTSHGVVGETALDVEVGWINNNDPIPIWFSFTKKHLSFTMIPSILPSPPMQAKMMLPVSEIWKSKPTTKKRVVSFVTSFTGGFNGQTNVLISVALGLFQTKRYEIRFVTTSPVNVSNVNVQRLQQIGIDVTHAPISVTRSLYNSLNQSTDLVVEYLCEKVDLYKETSSDPRLNKLVLPLVNALHGSDVVHFTNVERSKTNDKIIGAAALLSGVQHVLVDPGNLNSNPPTLYGVTGLIVPSYVAKEHWKQFSSINLPIHVVQPGAVLSIKSKESTRSIVHNRKRNVDKTIIAFVGRLDRIKTPSLFLHVAWNLLKHQQIGNELANLEFWFVGDGTLRIYLQEMAKDMLISDKVVFKGAVEAEQVVKLLNENIDIVIHTTMTNETFALVNVEAMGSGVPVISTCVGGIADYLRPGMMHGYCVDGSNVIESIVNKVKRLVNNEMLWNGYSQLGMEWVQKYGLKRSDMINRYDELYSSL